MSVYAEGEGELYLTCRKELKEKYEAIIPTLEGKGFLPVDTSMRVRTPEESLEYLLDYYFNQYDIGNDTDDNGSPILSIQCSVDGNYHGSAWKAFFDAIGFTLGKGSYMNFEGENNSLWRFVSYQDGTWTSEDGFKIYDERRLAREIAKRVAKKPIAADKDGHISQTDIDDLTAIIRGEAAD